MVRKFTYDFIVDSLKCFNDTTGLIEVAKILKVNPDNLSKAIRTYGFIVPKIKRPGHQRKDLPTDQIIIAYELGLSELELSKQFNVSRTPIRTILIESGCNIRNQSQANIVSMGRMTFEQRQDRAKAANKALTGTKRTHQELVKRSITKAINFHPQWVGAGEDEFAKALTELGIIFTRQTSCDVYNIDFTIGNVAVEFKSGIAGSSNVYSEQRDGRIKKLSDSGYIVCYIAFDNVTALLSSLDYIISNLNILTCNPTSVSKYWMIRCRFNSFTIFRNELGQYASKSVPIKLIQTIKGFDI